MSENETQPLPEEGFQLPVEKPAALPAETGAEMPAGEEPSPDDKLWAALSYISQFIVPVLVPVILLISETNKKRDFQRYHAVHSLALFAVASIYEVVAVIVYVILTAITAGCFGCILWPIFLLPVVMFVYYAYLAYSGEYFDVPYLTEFLQDQDWL